MKQPRMLACEVILDLLEFAVGQHAAKEDQLRKVAVEKRLHVGGRSLEIDLARADGKLFKNDRVPFAVALALCLSIHAQRRLFGIANHREQMERAELEC